MTTNFEVLLLPYIKRSVRVWGLKILGAGSMMMWGILAMEIVEKIPTALGFFVFLGTVGMVGAYHLRATVDRLGNERDDRLREDGHPDFK